MCALRHTRSVQPVALAQHYRLATTPRRPEPRKVTRRRKTESQPTEVVADDTADGAPVAPQEVTIDRRISRYDDSEEYDFDAEDDFYIDQPDHHNFQYDHRVITQSDLTHRLYLNACADTGVRPIKSIYYSLEEEDMTCKGLVLQQNDLKAITIALLSNSYIETITFEGNNMGPVGGKYFGDVLSRNVYLSSVSLTENRLGSIGAQAICKALFKNNTVRRLDLTGNDFRENDAVYFKELLEENSAIFELFLGHNFFREAGGEAIAEGLAHNDFVRVLDLSWNHLRLKGAAAISKALAVNTHLEVLNISWNGFYLQGAAHIARSLEGNRSLLDLDLSCNRLSQFCVAQLLQGLEKNDTLKKLRIGRNHISNTGAVMILKHMLAHPHIGLEYIDFGDQNVEDDFVKLLEELQQIRDIKVDYGVVWTGDREILGTQDETEDDASLLNENPQYVLMEFMRLQKLRLLDLFHQLDKDGNKLISVDEFKRGLESVNIPLRHKSLQKYVKCIDSNNDGEIEYLELLQAHKAYKAEMRRYVSQQIPIEDTPIGRIIVLLRKIMISNGHLVPPSVPT